VAVAEFLPLPEGFPFPNSVGGTPLVASRHLAKSGGLTNLYFKNDAVCFPSLSFKDRVVATALVAARRFGFQTVGCSSTGNLANAVAAQSAQQGFDVSVFIPADLEPAKNSEYGSVRSAHRAHQRQLRPREPVMRTDCGPFSVGTGKRESSPLLLGRIENARLRNSRATRLAASGQRGGARWPAAL